MTENGHREGGQTKRIGRLAPLFVLLAFGLVFASINPVFCCGGSVPIRDTRYIEMTLEELIP